MKPLCTVIRTLLLSVLLPWPSTGKFHVIGPSKPIIAIAGEEAVLSCHLDPIVDAQNMEVRWYRTHPSGLVHNYGKHMELQMPEYHGRTEFLKENIARGQVALRIHPIRPFDEGVYSCFFENSTYNKEAQLEMLVTGSGVAPHIHIEPATTGEVKLTCTSTGWYPEPEVQWRDQQGQRLAPDSDTKTKEENGLFYVKTSITMDKSSSEGALFPWSWIVGLSVPLGILVVANLSCCILCGVLIYKDMI
ncbi:PREDICTED: butyrophilin-like protein 2 isoform X2 [Condylura cristata]|uniref:butyrophilin-like protein 2 isoform X2 n=1 Tax=Condylura cristata TaxID=143302 RepID=UPI000642B9CA|nr:PREDICTED: butyrophilin-like protein 2 isoform X2 [Condylura cristata]